MPTTTTGVNGARISLVIPLVVAVTVACGGSSGSELSEAAEAGRQVAIRRGCAACHAADGTGGVGPKFVGLYGSEVTMSDGSTVVANDEYIRRSITDPGAEVVAGYAVNMPLNSDVTDEDIEALLAYIRELGTAP
jgi:cytochrome c oxidase subunit II